MEINYCLCTVVNDYKRRGVKKSRREQKGIFLSLEMEIDYCICTVVNYYKRRGSWKLKTPFYDWNVSFYQRRKWKLIIACAQCSMIDYKRRGIEKVSTHFCFYWKLVHNGVWGSENIDVLDSMCSAKISPTTIFRWVIFNYILAFVDSHVQTGKTFYENYLEIIPKKKKRKTWRNSIQFFKYLPNLRLLF